MGAAGRGREIAGGRGQFGPASSERSKIIYGLIVCLRTHPGCGMDVAHRLGELLPSMQGCLAHVVALDSTEPDTVWVTEVWEDQAAHRRWREAAETDDAVSLVLDRVISAVRTETLPLPWQ